MLDARVLAEMHAAAFSSGDWDSVKDLWHADAVLEAPTGIWPAAEWPAILLDLAEQYSDIDIVVTNVFLSKDDSYLAIEWTYSATRRADQARSTSPDAIIVKFHEGLIISWREYFDLSTSVELGQVPAAVEKQIHPGGQA